MNHNRWRNTLWSYWLMCQYSNVGGKKERVMDGGPWLEQPCSPLVESLLFYNIVPNWHLSRLWNGIANYDCWKCYTWTCWDAGHAITGAPCAGHAIAGSWVTGKAIAGNPVVGYGRSRIDRPVVPARRKLLDVYVKSWLKFSAAVVIWMYVITDFVR
jgi:hypothetical protein